MNTLSLSHFRQPPAAAGHHPAAVAGKLFRWVFRPSPNMFLITRSIRSTIPRAFTAAATPLSPLHHLPTGATIAAHPLPFGCYPATATPPSSSSSSCHHHLRPPSSSPPSSQPTHHNGAAGLCLNSQKGAPGLGIAP
ncbi:hypothetical protein Tco_0531292 [Tanacetum coccineum]